LGKCPRKDELEAVLNIWGDLGKGLERKEWRQCLGHQRDEKRVSWNAMRDGTGWGRSRWRARWI
jgi:hypothetical protein